ncbi:hypothetical protein RHMOL_Rhmol12G0019100 [Rhododendron molle]|uniref:Uncharacterized protein n=1 Tax=Rhododendron molle TaxID=49168 RepID=A0ACC0LDE2_RHOML|nr:hypothetical protein RHMOL_Rhmol12G0019100 [Rhododendron molle]
MEVLEDKLLNIGLPILLTLAVARLVYIFLSPRSPARLPPVIATWPVMGGVVRFLKGPVAVIREEYPKLGSVFTLNLLNKKITFLIGPEVSAHFFNGSESDLSQNEVYRFMVATLGPGVVYDVDYSVRLDQFRFCTEGLRANKLNGHVYQMLLETQWRGGHKTRVGPSDQPDSEQMSAERRSAKQALRRGVRSLRRPRQEYAQHQRPVPLPPHPGPPAPRPGPQEAQGGLRGDHSRAKAHRQIGERPAAVPDGYSRYRDGRPTTESEITGLLIGTLIAGRNTSSITATWTGAHLLSNKKYLPLVLHEQRNLVGKHGKKVDHDVLLEMEILYRCIKEALRLHPPQLLLRTSLSDFSVKTSEGKEYDVPKDHIIATSPAFANRLPHIYKDPDAFDPDRFAPGREDDKAAGAFSNISFGGGRHGCLGDAFAYLQIKATWSHLLRNFEVELVSPFPEIDWKSMVVGVKGKVMVRYKRRELPITH